MVAFVSLSTFGLFINQAVLSSNVDHGNLERPRKPVRSAAPR